MNVRFRLQNTEYSSMAELRQKMLARIEAGDAPTAITRNFGVARSRLTHAREEYTSLARAPAH